MAHTPCRSSTFLSLICSGNFSGYSASLKTLFARQTSDEIRAKLCPRPAECKSRGSDRSDLPGFRKYAHRYRVEGLPQYLPPHFGAFCPFDERLDEGPSAIPILLSVYSTFGGTWDTGFSEPGSRQR